jgi:hypothetical protein
MINDEDFTKDIEIDEDYYAKNIVQMRYNGKFFTGIFYAKSAGQAFDLFVETLLKNGHIKYENKNSILQLQFKTTLMSGDNAIGSFMWNHALAAEKSDIKIICSIFDGGGWRFFGRI